MEIDHEPYTTPVPVKVHSDFDGNYSVTINGRTIENISFTSEQMIKRVNIGGHDHIIQVIESGSISHKLQFAGTQVLLPL